MKSFSTILDYIFYKKCYFCSNKARQELICDKCFKKIKSTGFRKNKKVNGIEILGYYFYKDEILHLIRAVKYHNKKEMAGIIAKIITELAGKDCFSDKNTELIPVPLHKKRQDKRKYNQTELISEEISLLTGCKTNKDLIKRVKNTRPHYKLKQRERRENLRGAFKVNPEFYTGTPLIILDDISTTGVTMEFLIAELKKHNINNVKALVIAFAS